MSQFWVAEAPFHTSMAKRHGAAFCHLVTSCMVEALLWAENTGPQFPPPLLISRVAVPCHQRPSEMTSDYHSHSTHRVGLSLEKWTVVPSSTPGRGAEILSKVKAGCRNIEISSCP
jgi:hypothetical protein